MYPRLFELLDARPITVYTYGVLLAAAYLLGLQARDGRAPRRAASTQRACSTSASTSSSARSSARSCCCSSPTSSTFTRDPARAADAGALRRRVLRRPDPRGRRRALVHPPHRAAALDDVRRVRAGHRARPRRRPLRLPVRRLLLRQADDACRGAITFTDPFAAANVGTPLGVPLHPTQLYEAGAELLILMLLLVTERKGRPFAGPHVLAVHAALRDLALHHRVLPRRRARHGRHVLDVAVHLDVLAPLAIVMLVYLGARQPAAPEPRRAAAQGAA